MGRSRLVNRTMRFGVRFCVQFSYAPSVHLRVLDFFHPYFFLPPTGDAWSADHSHVDNAPSSRTRIDKQLQLVMIIVSCSPSNEQSTICMQQPAYMKGKVYSRYVLGLFVVLVVIDWPCNYFQLCLQQWMVRLLCPTASLITWARHCRGPPRQCLHLVLAPTRLQQLQV